MTKKILKILILTSILLGELFASFSFSLDKPSIHLVSKPGSSESYRITVLNENDQELNLKVYAMDWQYIENQRGKQFLPAGQLADSCAQWLDLGSGALVVPPHAKKDYEFWLKTPESAQGGHRAVIFFESEVVSLNAQKGLRYGARIGSLIYQESAERTKHELVILNKKISVSGRKLYYEINVKNQGNSWNSAKLLLSVLKSGDIIEQTQDGPANLLPGTTFLFKGELSNWQEGSELLISLEDYFENIITDRAVLSNSDADTSSDQIEGDATAAADATTESTLLTLSDFIADYQPTSKALELKANLKTGDSFVFEQEHNTKVIPQVKIFDQKNRKRVKTIFFKELSLSKNSSSPLAISWDDAGKLLTKGNYTAVLSLEFANRVYTAKTEFKL